MSELTICYSCGGRIYEHAGGCPLLSAVASAIDELTYERRNDFVGSLVMAEQLIARLQGDRVVLHMNGGECYVGDRLVGRVRA